MRFEALSRPKARDLSTPPDDVLLHIPGRVTAVFDGATDARKRRVGGVPFGRAAAMAAAQATARLPAEAVDWPVERILSDLSAAVGRSVPPDTEGGPASTTAIIAFEMPDSIRLVGLGDSGFRVNGGPVENFDLMPDRASTAARVALFRALRQSSEPDDAEALSQRYLGFGLDEAITDGAIGKADAARIIGEAIDAAEMPGAEDEIAMLLAGGLRRQYKFANNPDVRLGYGILNGVEPICATAVDRMLDRDSVTTLELFSDGYLAAPDTASVAAWEEVHERLEARDPNHIDAPMAVKGSTASHFFDDRTIAILGYAKTDDAGR